MRANAFSSLLRCCARSTCSAAAGEMKNLSSLPIPFFERRRGSVGYQAVDLGSAVTVAGPLPTPISPD